MNQVHKNTSMFSSTKLALAAMLSLGAVSTLNAGTYWFDGGTVNIGSAGNGAAAGINGDWKTGLVNWDQGNALAHVAWTNLSTDTAVFGGSNTKVVTVTGTQTVGTISMGNSGWAFNGGTIDADIIDANGTGTTTFNSNLTGTLKVMATGSTVNLTQSASVLINSDNTGLLTSTEVALNQDNNHIIINHAAAFGSASATVNISKGMVNLGNAAAPNNNVPVSYNAWATDFAGTLRGRFSESTWNGATKLTGNAQLMTRNATGVKLIFSNTGTINLQGNTLSLYSSNSAAGIELNGVISGSGNLQTGGGFGLHGGSDNATGITTLSAVNTYTGNTVIKAGTVVLSSTGTIANSANIIVGDAGSTSAVLDVSAKTGGFTIGSGQKLSGIGTVDADASGTLRTVTIAGTHAPGNSAGVQTVQGDLEYGASSVFEWELTSNTSSQGTPPAYTFDQVAVTGALNIVAGAKINLDFDTGVDFSNAFWSSNQSWTIFTGATSVTGNFTINTISLDSTSAAYTASHPYGSFSINGSTLSWTAIPELSNVLIGGLIGVGMLRRRRMHL